MEPANCQQLLRFLEVDILEYIYVYIHLHLEYIQGGFFDCSALKMTKCQPLKEISELFLQKNGGGIVKKTPCMLKQNLASQGQVWLN